MVYGFGDGQSCFRDWNKLKSLKVAQVKDEMNGDEDDGCDVVFDVCDVVCDVAYDEVWCFVVLLCCVVM